jgi:putative immunity protein/bacteriocin
MKKTFIVLLSLIMTFVTLTGFSSPGYTISDVEAIIYKSLSEDQKELFNEFKGNSGNIEHLTKKEEQEILKSERKNSEIKEFLQNLRGEYKEVTPSDYSSLAISDDNGNAFMKFRIFKAKKSDSIIITTSLYDPNTGDLLKFYGEKGATADGQYTNKVVIDYNLSNSDSGVVSTAGFIWEGETFVCGMIGVIACIYYCSHFKSLRGVQDVCSGVCGTAFVIGCMS